jgi:hypothetical protein
MQAKRRSRHRDGPEGGARQLVFNIGARWLGHFALHAAQGPVRAACWSLRRVAVSWFSNTALASGLPRHAHMTSLADLAAVLEPLWLGLPQSAWPAALMCAAAVAVRGPLCLVRCPTAPAATCLAPPPSGLPNG